MRRRCLEIVDRSNMGFEFWSLNSCLYQRFGMKELYLIITQPVYEIKMKCLKEMMIVRSFGSESHPQNALNDMEASRTAVESVIQKQDYDRFVQKQLELFQKAMVDDVETLQEYGLEVTYPDREEMKAAGSGVIDEYRAKYPEFDDIMNKIEPLQEEYRANADTADAGAAETAETAEAAA